MKKWLIVSIKLRREFRYKWHWLCIKTTNRSSSLTLWKPAVSFLRHTCVIRERKQNLTKKKSKIKKSQFLDRFFIKTTVRTSIFTLWKPDVSLFHEKKVIRERKQKLEKKRQKWVIFSIKFHKEFHEILRLIFH